MRARGLLAWATIGVVAGGAFAAYILVSASRRQPRRGPDPAASATPR